MLTDAKIRRAVPAGKPYKLADSGGLYLLVTPAGGKLWRMNYVWQGRNKTLSFGRYPVMTLEGARTAAVKAKRELAEGRDPGAEKKREQGALFGPLAMQWYERNRWNWSAVRTRNVGSWLSQLLLPVFGNVPIVNIGNQEIDAALQRVLSERSLSIAINVKQVLNGIFGHAAMLGIIPFNPVLLLRKVLPPLRSAHRPSITDPEAVGRFLRVMENPPGRVSVEVQNALRMLALVFTRPGELCAMEWCELDLSQSVWRIPAEKMKMRMEHLVPLSRQAVALVEGMREVSGGGRYVFPAHRKQAIHVSTRSLEDALFRWGYKGKLSPHGFRATARTLLHERLHFSPDAIEAQLAHRVPDRLGAAYNRSQHLEERVRMMQAWADYLEELKQNLIES